MKKLVLAVAVMALLAGNSMAACQGPYCFDDTGAQLTSAVAVGGAVLLMQKTIAQLNALQSTTTGQLVMCTNCTQSSLCVSSGTVAAGAWVIAVATGVFVGSTYSGFTHCQ